MIKFFRKTRQKMQTENKVSKYLLYAIGEVILVVIGILIALSVNNSNIQRLENARVDRLNEKLKTQLEANLMSVDEYIETNELFYSSSKRLLAIIGEPKDVNTDAKIDSLIFFNTHDYHLNLDMNIIAESRENGDIALISNDLLSQSIYYFTTYYKKIVEDEGITNSNLNNHFTYYLNKNYNINNLINRMSDEEDWSASKIYKADNYKILTDQEFENLITVRILHSEELLESYIELRDIIFDTYKLLE